MLSSVELSVFYVGAYVWFVIGALYIALPALKELYLLMKSANRKEDTSK